MSAFIIQPPFDIFTDIDGQPLEAGYIYVGTADLDPITNPVNVYWDEALTQVAAQPLRTIGGYIVNNGTPANIYTGELSYSMTVMNRNGSTLYTLPNSSGFSANPLASDVEFTGFKSQSGTVQDLADDDGADWIGFDPNGASAVARSVQAKLRESVSVKDFGAVGDGVTDDTAAIQAAYAAANNIIFPTGIYAVTHLTFSGVNKIIEFQSKAKLYGIATTTQDSVLTLHNFRQSKIINLEIESDGRSSSPVYYSNYKCGLRITSDTPSSPSQFITIDGLNIRYIKVGLVSGNFLGDAAQPQYAQSEIFIRDYKVRGVMQQLYQNAFAGIITTSGCVYVTQQFESGSWWDNAECFNLRCDTGTVVSVGDEFQAARQTGFNLYGKRIRVIGPVWEDSCGCYLTGDVSITDISNGFFGNGALDYFRVDPNAVGELLLTNANIRRPDNTATFSGNVLVDAKNNNDYKISIVNTRIKEFAYDVVNRDAHFVLGGKLFIDNLTFDNSASTAVSYAFVKPSGNIVGFDTTGESMSTSIDLTPKGGFTSPSGSGGFGKYTADLPSGFSSAIRFTTTGGGMSVESPTGTNAIPISGGKDILLAMFLKRLGGVSSFNIKVIWHDYAGNLISQVTGFAANDARLDSNGFDEWQQLRIPVSPPQNAVYMSLVFALGSSADVGVTGISLN